MSRVHEAGHSADIVPGDVALPLPNGDPAGLRTSARALQRAASRAVTTTTVRGVLGARLGAVWTGDAAAAARTEAEELGRRSCRVVDGLSGASRSLQTYAAALDDAIGRVRSLQRQWDALDAEHALTAVRLASLPDPTGAVGVLGLERSRAEQAAGRARLSRSYAAVLDELRGTGRRCAAGIAAVTDVTFPSSASPSADRVRSAVTGGLWFADGVVVARESRSAALADSALVRRALAGGAGVTKGGSDLATQVAARIRARDEDCVYAQSLLSELGTDGLAQLLMGAGVTRSDSGVHVDAVRELLGALGSLVLTATSHSSPGRIDPRTRAQLASGAALLTDDLVAGLDRVQADASGGGRATGAWLLGQLLSGARATGDDRRLPVRLARRAAAAAATAEIAESRDSDTQLRHGTTLRADAHEPFASWFDDASHTGDPLHVLLAHIGDDAAEHRALLAEPLPDSSVAGGALSNSRGDRMTLGEHLVRRWITYEASGIESHPGQRLATDADLARLLPSISASTAAGAAETRARVMLEVSRTSAHAMLEPTTTSLYTSATAPVERLVADWFSAMRENVDLALTAPLATSPRPAGYAAATSRGMEPWLDSNELTGVVGALAVDTGMGLHAKGTGAAYDRLVDRELQAAKDSVDTGGDAQPDLVRLGFFDQAASAALVALARRQDDLNRSAWQGLAEAGHVVGEIRQGGVAGLVTTVHTYAEGGTLRSAGDDLVISLIRSDVELAQTELDDARHAALVRRIEALTGRCTDVTTQLAVGAGRAPLLPSAADLRTARAVEIQAAADAAIQDGGPDLASSVMDRVKNRPGATHRIHVAEQVTELRPATPAEIAETIRRAHPTGSALKADALHRSGAWVVDDIPAKGTVFVLIGGDGAQRTLVQMPGTVNGIPGRFEWIVEEDRVTHQLFVRGGNITGVPIKP